MKARMFGIKQAFTGIAEVAFAFSFPTYYEVGVVLAESTTGSSNLLKTATSLLIYLASQLLS